MTVLGEWESCAKSGSVNSDALWTAIDATGCASGPYQPLLAALHTSLLGTTTSALSVDSGRLERGAAGAALYLALQRHPGSRGRGLCSALTFHQILNFVGVLADAHQSSLPEGGDNDADYDELMGQDCDGDFPYGDNEEDADAPRSQERRPRRAAAAVARRRVNTKLTAGKRGSGEKTCGERVVAEFASSLGFLPLVPGGDEEPLSRAVGRDVLQFANRAFPLFGCCPESCDHASAFFCFLPQVDALVACLASQQAGLASAGANALLKLQTTSSHAILATPLILKGLMPILLCEKVRGSMGGSSAGGHGSRGSALAVVNGLLDAVEPSPEPSPEQVQEGGEAGPVPLSTSLLVLIEHLCHRAPEKVRSGR